MSLVIAVPPLVEWPGLYRFFRSRSPWSVVATLMLVTATLSATGCSSEAPITQYTVKRESTAGGTRAELGNETTTGAQPGSSVAAVPGEARDRMLGAMVPRGDRNWFFKLTGPKASVALAQDAFQEFVKSLEFSAGPGNSQPTWTLPSGWTQKPGSEMRFATIEIPAEPRPVEMSVIPLPRDPTAEDGPAVLANVNRWRGQISLPPLAMSALDKETQTLDLAGTKVTLVDFTGTLTGSGMMPLGGPAPGSLPAAPTTKTAGPKTEATAPAKAATPATTVAAAGKASADETKANAAMYPFTYRQPAEWKEEPPTGMRKLVYRAGADAQDPLFTVIPLDGGMASDILPNVNRWRSQIKLKDITADELATQIKKRSFGSASGESVELLGEQEAILGAIVRSGNLGWFFKLTGSRAAIERERPRFEAFLDSVRFP